MVDPARRASSRGILAVLALAALAGGCGGMDARALAVHRLEGELVRLRAQNAALGERVDALEIQADGLRAGPVVVGATAAPGRGAPADGPSSSPPGDDRPALEVVRLVPNGAPQAKVAVPEDGERSKDAAERAGLATAEYDRAAALLAGKKYDAALNAFAGFVVRYPEHPRAAEATLRRGECYLSKGEHARAVEQIEAALVAAPRGATAPEALALLARAHLGAGAHADALRARERLLRDFPDHPAAKKLATREGSR